MRYSSAIITRAPWPAAIRAARTPPEPPPMTNRSTSNSAMVSPIFREWRIANGNRPAQLPAFYSLLAIRHSPFASLDFLAALLHLGAELAVDHFGKALRPF